MTQYSHLPTEYFVARQLRVRIEIVEEGLSAAVTIPDNLSVAIHIPKYLGYSSGHRNFFEYRAASLGVFSNGLSRRARSILSGCYSL